VAVSGASGKVYRFETFTIDPVQRLLRRGDRDIELRPKSFDVLCCLLANSGRVVGKDELLEAVWPDVTVTDESLTRCVSDIRLALDDAAQRIIKTVPKRGYLLAAAVSVEESSGPAPADISVAAKGHDLSDTPSVAVLPFANLSGDAAQEYLSDGITEDIINGLSYFSDLSVIARNSSFSYKGRASDVRDVGRQLGVRYLVEGSVRRAGDRIRITAQLVDAQTGVRRWSERFDRALGDVFAVQDEITQSIVRIVVAHLGNAEVQRIARKPPSSWTAYDLMLQGDQRQRELEQSWDVRLLHETRALFAEALRVDPENARICAKLAHTYIRGYTDPALPDCGNLATLQTGYELAVKAVGLEPTLPAARTQLGWAYCWMKEPDAAIREFEKAAALNPNFLDFPFPATLVYAGEPARSLGILQGYFRLDPFYPPQLHAIHGHALYMLERYEEAATALRECIRRGPQVAIGELWLAATLVRLGQQAAARDIAAAVVRRLPHLAQKPWPALSIYRNPRHAEHVVGALRAAGVN
jgi:adenylate cyclase